MVKASNVDMSLEDIISKNRKKGGIVKRPSGGRGGLKRPIGGNRRRSDGWRDIDAPGNSDFVSRGSGNKIIRVNISNLASSVIASDLDELFGKYGIESAVVNYNEHGESLGNGDITLRKLDAERLIKQFTGVALDGKVMKFAIVDNSSMRGRVDFGGRRSGGPVGGRSRPAGRKFNRSKPEDFLRDGVHEGDVKRGGGGRRGGRGGKRGEGRPKKTEAELDAELEAYMSKRNA